MKPNVILFTMADLNFLINFYTPTQAATRPLGIFLLIYALNFVKQYRVLYASTWRNDIDDAKMMMLNHYKTSSWVVDIICASIL